MTLTGIAINRNIKNNLDEFFNSFKLEVVEISNSNIDDAISNDIQGTCDLIFSEKGTIIIIGPNHFEEIPSESKDEIMTFVLSETSMSFMMNYYQNGVHVRETMETEGMILTSEGELVNGETDEEDVNNSILGVMEYLTGYHLYNFPDNLEAKRVTFRSK